ncbi:MAG: glycosyltransferase [Ignavibacteriaceae bacterium]|nr:glycosyltransferase [Ignavibacteriaceae bacterium]
MKKVLVISYFWPPSGKASVHWPLKIIKHLPEFDCEPYVLTVAEDSYTRMDESMLNEINPALKVYKSKSFEPFRLYKIFTGRHKNEHIIDSETISSTNKNLTHRLSIWIRMNLFVPDARIGWYFNAVRLGKKIISKNKIDAIISIGPPHSTQLIALRLSKLFRIPHYPVFIDPWIDIIYYKAFKRSKITLALDNYFERKVLKHSKASIFITHTMKDDYSRKYAFLKEKSFVLYWGYDEDSFNNVVCERTNVNNTIVHAGNIFDYQNPVNFWKLIKHKIDSGQNLKLKFIGSVSPAIKNEIANAGLEAYAEYAGFLPYKELVNQLLNAKFLLVCASEPRHVPGKLFEYLRTGKPIIAFGNDNKEVSEILKNSNAGMIFNYNQNGSDFFDLSENFKTNLEYVKKFERQSIARQFSEIIHMKDPK